MANALRVKPSGIIAARLEALRNGTPFPDLVPDPDLRDDPESLAGRELRLRFDSLAAAHLDDR